MGRTNLAVDDKLAEELSKEAKKRNKTLFAITNEIISEGLEVLKHDIDYTKISSVINLYTIIKDLEAVPIPARIIDKMISLLYKTNKDELLQLWYSAGKILGDYLAFRLNDVGEFVKLVNKVKDVLWLRKVEINIKNDGIYVELVGTGFGIESTECTSMALRGLVESFGLKVIETKLSPGIVYSKISYPKKI